MQIKKIFILIICIIIIITVTVILIDLSLVPKQAALKFATNDKSNTKSALWQLNSRAKRYKINYPGLNDKFQEEKKNTIKKVKTIIINDNNLYGFDLESNDIKDYISQFKTNSNIKLPKQFENWETDHSQLTNWCIFGYLLIQNYEKNGDIVYNNIATDIIKKIGNKFETVIDYCSTNPFGLQKTKWLNSIINLTRFLAAYEYIGNNNVIKESVCDYLINKIIPAIDHATKIGFDHIYSLHFAMVRLLTNYLYNENDYIKDLWLINKEKSISSLNVPVNESDKIRRGVYRDGSCISFVRIANYRYLQKNLYYRYFNFYEQICQVIGVKVGSLPKIVKEVSEKLCHPQSPHVPFGLFDTEGYTVRTNWWSINGTNGVFILPFIGLGVFKNEKMIFSVRVQRPGIAVCKLDDKKTGDFILGSIQLRRIYLTNQSYPTKLTWEKLINEPGIISFIDASGVSRNLFLSQHIKNDAYYCDKVNSNNFIGSLYENGNVLFWFNEYTCTLIHATITEIGLMTDNGLESYYIIHNHGPNAVQFRIQDQSSEHGQLIVVSEPTGSGGFVKFPPSEPVPFSWKMLFDDRKSVNLSYNLEEKRISFNYKSHFYKIFMKGESRFIVERDDVILSGGSSSSDPNHSMEINGNVLKRNPVTFMYF